MKNIHASEQVIQDYATNGSLNEEQRAHIESCMHCQKEAAAYQLLFSRIKDEPVASFEFDLSGMVLSQLPATRSRLSADKFIAGFLLLFIGGFIGIPVILFRQYILNMFSGISPFFIYSIVFSAILILSYQAIGMYKKFRKQMQLLNFN